jgi:rhodanese-related sulfurtransferase
MTKTTPIALAIFLILASLASPPAQAQFGGLFGGGASVESITTQELHQRLSDQQKAESLAKESDTEVPKADFVVVDVRSDSEIKVSMIPGAISKAEYEQDRSKYEGRTVIPYCTVGGRSGAYAKQLAAKGVKVKNYRGSILKWVEAELPLVTPDGKPTNRVHTYSDRYRVPAKYEQVTQ